MHSHTYSTCYRFTIYWLQKQNNKCRIINILNLKSRITNFQMCMNITLNFYYEERSQRNQF